MNRKKHLEDGDKEFLKNIKILDAMWTAQASLAWWHEESSKLHDQAKKVEEDFQMGAISEEEAIEKGREIGSKISYLENKGQFERKTWENIISGKK